MAAGYPNRLVIDPGAGFVGIIDGSNTLGSAISSTLELASGASSGTLSGVGSLFVNFGGSIAFDAGGHWLVAGNTIGLASGEVLSGFANGDTIELTGLTETIEAYSAGTLTLGGDAPVSLHLPGTFTSASFIATPVPAGPDPASGGTDITLACFAAGTRIRTERGDIAVEALQLRDKVAVLPDDRLRPVIWIGHRVINCARHLRPEQVWPVRIAAGAFGHDLPWRDLLLSPDHAIFAQGVLIPVRYLVNGSTIIQLPVNEVTYYHVELPQHSVLRAEGLPVESYLDVGDRAHFADTGRIVMLHPDFSARIWDSRGCAPLVVTGPILNSVRRRIMSAAAVLKAELAERVELSGEGKAGSAICDSKPRAVRRSTARA